MKRLPLLGAAALGLFSVCASASADACRPPRYADRYDHDYDRGSWRSRDRYDDRYDHGRFERETRHTFRVLYRSGCGSGAWREYGRYECRESAERAARRLQCDRYDVRLVCA